MQFFRSASRICALCRPSLLLAILLFTRLGYAQVDPVLVDRVESASNTSPTDVGSLNVTPESARVPPQNNPTQREIEREARRLQVGVRGGVGLDP
jgi:hypothetical protein